MSNPQSVASPSRHGPVWLWAVLWFVTYFVARGLLERPHAEALVRVATALAPMPFATLTMLFLMTIGLLQRAILLKFEDWSYLHVWPMLMVFYFLGVVLARKRYS